MTILAQRIANLDADINWWKRIVAIERTHLGVAKRQFSSAKRNLRQLECERKKLAGKRA